MDKNLKRKILLVTIIISVAIVFVPIYIFVLASSEDDSLYVSSKKITAIVDGTPIWDANDNAGNDSSDSNKRVRTFDKITYTVKYVVSLKTGASSTDAQGRKVRVEVLIPTTYKAVLKNGEENINLYGEDAKVNRSGVDYYRGVFTVDISNPTLGEQSELDFSLEDIYSSNIDQYNSIKPLVFINETTDSNPNYTDIACELTNGSNDCNVTITGTGEGDFFVNMYSGDKKDIDNETRVPIGLLIGLKTTEGKGIKGTIIPKTLSFSITDSNISKLGYTTSEGSPLVYTYEQYGTQQNPNYNINIDSSHQMPEIKNGTISGAINAENNNQLDVTISDIDDYLVRQYNGEFYYFSTNYFLTTLAPRGAEDYSDITVTLTANKNNSGGTPSSTQVIDAFNYILGNYSSKIDIHEGESTDALEYGKANINYGSDFVVKTNFDYTGINGSGDGLTSLTNYIKIDNNVFKLHENTNHAGYNFTSGEPGTSPSIQLDIDNKGNQAVYFGFGKWTSEYFEATNAANCPQINFNNPEDLMKLYGGPCIRAKDSVKWAYSPVAESDINEDLIDSDISSKGPLIVKSTYVAYTPDDTPKHIGLSSSGTLELYAKVINDHTIAQENPVHQIVTNATALARDDSDFVYLGNEHHTGESLMTDTNNFVKTDYNFTTKKVIHNNNNLCSDVRCPVTGATILISGVKVTKPVLKSHKVSDLINTESNFYYYPLALTVDAAASKGDDILNFDTVFVNIYLPSYMSILENYGTENDKHTDRISNIRLSQIYDKFDLGTLPQEREMDYKVYEYVYNVGSSDLSEEEKANLQSGILSKFTVYADIDVINTENAAKPEIFADVDFKVTKTLLGVDDTNRTIEFQSIMPDADRMDELNNITLYNSSAVISKTTAVPTNIERGGTYKVNMLAYNHSKTVIEEGYSYPTADLYYILPYDGDTSIGDIGSKPGTTKYKVSFDTDSINAIQNRNDYKFYYATEGVPSNIIPDEIKTTSDPSAIWHEWANPTQPVSDVIAIKVVKQSPYAPDTYFGSSSGLTLNVQTIGSTDGNTFYNSFHLLATKPANYTCDEIPEEPDYCTESNKIKANYSSSPSITSVYAREISGFVFEDFDYNGIYTSDESKLKDIPVSLYKKEVLPEDYDPIDPTTFVSDDDELVGATTTSETGSYYFNGLSSGIYYVSFTINNKKYIVAPLEKTDDSIPDSSSNNSSASLLPNTNRAISSPIEFPAESSSGRLIVSNINLGLNVKKEMALELNKYITEVSVTKNGRTETHDYSKQKLSKVSITVLNPRDTKVRVKYSFSVENIKYFPGYVGMIVDTMPQGMTFNPNLKENQYWVQYGNLLYYNGLGGKLLLPNEKQYFSLVLDLDLKEAGTYRNVVSARDLTLMGEELPVYDFSELSNSNNEGGE